MIETIKSKRTIYVDVDGTLIFWPQPNPGAQQPNCVPKVNHKLVTILREWKALDRHNVLIVWSAGGADHVSYAVKLAEIEDIVDYKLSKPEVFIDDQYGWYEKRLKIRVVGAE